MCGWIASKAPGEQQTATRPRWLTLRSNGTTQDAISLHEYYIASTRPASARYSRLYSHLRWSYRRGGPCISRGWHIERRVYVCLDTRWLPLPRLQPRVPTFLRMYQGLHLAWKAMIISRCTHKNWLACCALARIGLQGDRSCTTLFGGMLRLFQTLLLKEPAALWCQIAGTWLKEAAFRLMLDAPSNIGILTFASSMIPLLPRYGWSRWLFVASESFVPIHFSMLSNIDCERWKLWIDDRTVQSFLQLSIRKIDQRQSAFRGLSKRMVGRRI